MLRLFRAPQNIIKIDSTEYILKDFENASLVLLLLTIRMHAFFLCLVSHNGCVAHP